MMAIRAQKVEATTGFEPVNRGFAASNTHAGRHLSVLHRTTAAYHNRPTSGVRSGVQA